MGCLQLTYEDNFLEENHLDVWKNSERIACEEPSEIGVRKDHLGNVHLVLSDLLPEDNTDFSNVQAAYEYYPFGMAMQTFESSDYRYGFNGKEKDLEGAGGGGTTYDYGFRLYNPQLAKFLSVDPLSPGFPWYSPYQFAGNKPVIAIDLDGLEEFRVTWVPQNNTRAFVKLELLNPDPSKGLIVHHINFMGTNKNVDLGHFKLASLQQFMLTHVAIDEDGNMYYQESQGATSMELPENRGVRKYNSINTALYRLDKRFNQNKQLKKSTTEAGTYVEVKSITDIVPDLYDQGNFLKDDYVNNKTTSYSVVFSFYNPTGKGGVESGKYDNFLVSAISSYKVAPGRTLYITGKDSEQTDYIKDFMIDKGVAESDIRVVTGYDQNHGYNTEETYEAITYDKTTVDFAVGVVKENVVKESK